mgnify:CR=1 FL=1
MQILTIGMNTGRDALVAAGFAGIKYPAKIKVTNLVSMPVSMREIGVNLHSKAKKDGQYTATVVVQDQDLLSRAVVGMAQIAALNKKEKFVSIQVAEDEPEAGSAQLKATVTRKATRKSQE